jgi:hypothetical protein
MFIWKNVCILPLNIFDHKKIICFMSIAIWEPTFTGKDGKMNVKVDESDIQYLIGPPDCGKMQMWKVYHDPAVSIIYMQQCN